ncbi:CDP-glycerol glycerophosphotransferase family protein [Virgibacillus doumboii]|uniref:CDP-glycerol glycerophosphotransferase family protein n=1 Tax=Virgibacillus doumboii TaxID=2697503 RepID=UPI0013DF186E|nr:CDP-glycerol glycerophosphotransferase family protein [Virgibacillus doumboii]
MTKKIASPYTINFIDVQKNDTLTIRGIIRSEISNNDTILLLIKKRKTEVTYTFPLNWISSNYWESTINFNSSEFSKGTWDYFLLYNNDKKYRLKIDDGNIFDWTRSLLFNNNNLTFGVKCYITEKGSLSSKIYTPTVKISNLKSGLSDDHTANLTAGLVESEFIDSKRLSDARLIIKQRNSDKELTTPFSYTKSPNNIFYITINLDYNDIIPKKLTGTRWDLFIQVPINNSNYLLRIKVNDSVNLEKNTCIELNGPELFQTYFYQTINNNLSISLTGLKINRNVLSYSINDKNVNFKGFAYYNLVNFNTPKSLQRNIIVKKRNSGKEIKFAIDNIEIPDLIEDDYRYSGFDISIPLKEIFSLQGTQMEVFDFYIQLIYGDQIKERGLGCKEYSYLVDDPLDTNSLMYNKKSMRSFLLYTPGGNFKLETYAYSLSKMLYLKYGQTYDRKINANKDVWLIGERPDTAQDTGFHFFKYCRENFPEKDIYYVVKENSPDMKNLSGLGNVITFGSMKHFRIAAIAKTFIGSHDLEYILPTRGIDWFNYQENSRVFLQHGVLGRKKVDYYKKHYQYPFNLFCVSSTPEFELVTKQMGYNLDEVKITGLSRFDQLKKSHQTERSIIIIPTWRDWIKENEFLDSEYFNRYRELLVDERLSAILEENNIKLDFYVHYRMQPYIQYFQELKSDHTSIIKFGQSNVQDLLINNNLLITDYSSVSFDFNYMRKPVLFYHFDFDRFFKNGILRPINETFLGDICNDKEMLIDSIEKYITNDFTEAPAVKKRKNLVFSYTDNNNNKRIFDAIINKRV